MQDVIHRAQHADQEAFRLLVEAYQPLVAKTAHVLLSDRDMIDDATQDIWLDVWRGLHNFRVDAPFRPWLLKVVANRCRMLLRQKRPVTTSLDAVPLSALPRSDDVLWLAIQRETATELLAAIKTLSLNHQRVLALHYYAGLDISEIATVLGIPLGTTKSRLHRAIETIRTTQRTHQRSEELR